MGGFGLFVTIIGIVRMSDGGLWGLGTAFAFLLFAFLLWRAARLQVVLTDETLEVRNFFSSYHLSRSEVRRVEVLPSAAGVRAEAITRNGERVPMHAVQKSNFLHALNRSSRADRFVGMLNAELDRTLP